MALHHNPRMITAGLDAMYDARDKNSYVGFGSTFNDLAKDANLTLVNSPTYNSEGSFTFDGSNTKIEGAHTRFGYDTAFTLGVWFNTNTTQTVTAGLISMGYFPILLFRTDGKIRLWTSKGTEGTATGYPSVVSSGTYVDGNWHYAVGTYGGSVGTPISLYIDGVFEGSTTSDEGIRNMWDDIEFGIEKNNGPKIFDGKIASGHIYNRALTADEILQNYNATKTRFGL